MSRAPYIQNLDGHIGLADAFEAVTNALPDKRGFGFLPSGTEIDLCWSYAALAARIASFGEHLADQIEPGARVVLACDPGPDFLTAFLGTIYAGAVAVPVPVPRYPNQARRVEVILRDADARAIIVRDASLLDLGPGVTCITPDMPDRECEWRPRIRRADDLAFIQYTSGSTSSPKGVMISHANVLANSALLGRALDYDHDSVSLTWLPPSHDMGLIEGLLQPILHGVGALVMAPETFLRRPLRWLGAIDRHRVTHSGGPNFAFQLCLDHARRGRAGSLDLASWRLAYVGAEPIRFAVLEAFAQAFAANGFNPDAFHASYGLAEATLLVSEGPAKPVRVSVGGLERGRIVTGEAASADGRTLVSCGRPYPEMRVAIIDPQSGEPCAGGQVGEICISGKSVTTGYWQGEGALPQADTFEDQAGCRWLKTGDLGGLVDGQLIVTGRRKDLIILNGRNLFPHDIEQAIMQAIPELRRPPVAFDAFGLASCDFGGMVIAIETGSIDESAFEQLCAGVRKVLAEEFEAECTHILALGRGEVQFTTSGKVMRADLRDRFGRGSLAIVQQWVSPHRDGGLAALTDEPSTNDLLRSKFGDLDGQGDRLLAELGADSMLAVQIAEALVRDSGQSLRPAELLRMTLGQIRAAASAPPTRPVEADQEGMLRRPEPGGAIAATEGQRGLYFLHQLWGTRDPFWLTLSVALPPAIDIWQMHGALCRLIDRHPLLGSRFAGDESGKLVQFLPVSDPNALVRVLEDPSGIGFAKACQGPPEPLADGALFSATLYRSDGAAAGLAFQAHHAVVDASSVGNILNDIKKLYDGESLEKVAPLAPVMEAAQRAEHGVAAAEFWRSRLDGAPLNFGLSTDHQRPLHPTFAAARASRDLSGAMWRDVAALARSKGITPASVCLAAFAALCARNADSKDVVIGVPLHQREVHETAAEVGLVTRTVLLRIQFQEAANVAWLLAEADQALFEAQVNQPFALEPMVRELAGAPVGDEPVPRLLFNFIADEAVAPLLRAWACGGSGQDLGFGFDGSRMIATGVPGAYHDLVLHIVNCSDRTTVIAHYSRELFRPERIERLLDQFLTTLTALITSDACKLAHLPLLGAGETRQLLKIAGNSDGRAPAETLHELISKQAGLTPDAIAIAAEGGNLTYGEVVRRTEALAAFLQNAGVQPGDRVGLHLERSPDLVIAAVAIMKCGAAYVPMDPRYPNDRLRGMIEDARVAVIVTRNAADWMAGVRTIPPDLTAGASRFASVVSMPDSAAYVLFTSGTTGRPKGVVISHRSAAGLISWAHAEFGDSLSRVFASTSASFDLSIFEMFAPLTSGGTVIVAESLLSLPEMAEQFQPTLASGVPSVFAALLERGRLPPLKALAVAGEPLGTDLADRLLQSCPGVALYDLYGPTEVTTYATGGRRRRGDRPSIGYALPWTQVYLLDQHMQLVPWGATGEVWLGGDRVAQGYIGRSGWTADRFRPDPFTDSPGALMYRTGDAGSFRPDGSLVYRGRLDRQIKLRGYRIEQGEIEAVLESHPAVTQVAVLVLPGTAGNAGERLVACVAPAQVDTDAILDRAAQRLPPFMVPSAVYTFERLPMTPNGKLDRDAVARLAHDAAIIAGGRSSSARHSSSEGPSGSAAAIVRIVEQTIGISGIAADQSPFELGATSLDAVRIQQALLTEFGVEIPLRKIIGSGTPQEISALLEMAGQTPRSTVGINALTTPETKLEDRRALHFAERQLLASCLAPDGAGAFLIPVLLRLGVSTTYGRLMDAGAKLARWHPTLRQRLDQATAVVHLESADQSVPVPLVALNDSLALQQLAREPFDLADNGPLRLVAVGSRSCVQSVLVVAHHLFLDGASLAILIPDLLRLIRDPDQMLPIACAGTGLPSVQRQHADATFWREYLAGAAASAIAPQGGLAGAPVESGMTERLELPEALSCRIRERSKCLGTTPFCLMLCAFLVLLAKRSGSAEQLVAVPYDLRASSRQDGAVGMFAQPLLIRVNLAGHAALPDLLDHVRTSLADAMEHGSLPFEQMLNQLGEERAFGDSFYHVLFASQDGIGSALARYGDGTTAEILDTGGARADLTALLQTEGEGPIRIAFEFRRALYGPTFIQSLLHDWSAQIDQLLQDGAELQFEFPAAGAMAGERGGMHATAVATPADSKDRGRIADAVAIAWKEVLGSTPKQGDSFFASGGDSLLAVRLLGRIEQDLHVQLTLKEFFGRTTFAELVTAIVESVESSAQELVQLPKQVSTTRKHGPLCLAQQQMLFFERLTPGIPLYNVGMAYALSGALDVDRLNDAVLQVVNRYSSLRLRLTDRPPPGTQTIHPLEQSETVLHKLEPRSGGDPALQAFFAHCYDLEEEPPFRAGLLRRDDNLHVLALSAHHAAVDAQSLGRIATEIGLTYRGAQLSPPDPYSPLDHAAWEAECMAGPAAPAARAYWHKTLAGLGPALNLPFDPSDHSSSGTITFRLESDALGALAGLAAHLGVGLVTIVLAAYAKVLCTLSGQSAIVIGLPINTRRHPHMDSVGFFSNTVPLAIRQSPDISSEEFIRSIREAVSGAQDMGWMPLPAIVDVWLPERDAKRPALFNAMFAMETGAQTVAFDATCRRLPVDLGLARCDLLLLAREDGDGLEFQLQHATESVPGFANEVVNLLRNELMSLQADVSSENDAEDQQSANGEYSAKANAVHQVWREVLGLDKVSDDSTFFELGGTSLQLVHVQIRLEQILGREVPLSLLFSTPRLVDLAKAIADHTELAVDPPNGRRRDPSRLRARRSSQPQR